MADTLAVNATDWACIILVSAKIDDKDGCTGDRTRQLSVKSIYQCIH